MPGGSRGFVYVATGEGYVHEAIQSANQLKVLHPNHKVCLVTDSQNGNLSIFDDVIILGKEDVSHTPIDKIHCVSCPYEEAIFLDSDTWVAGELHELFDILKAFDLALLPENKRGWDYLIPEVPRPFSEFNTGVIVFKNSTHVKSLFNKWGKEYWKLRDDQELKNDQPSFRLIIWNSNIRIAPIPSEYHFLANGPNYIMWQANLIHGRGDLKKIAHSVNKNLGSRVYVPHIGVLSGYAGRWHWIKQSFFFIAKSFSLLWKKKLDPSVLAPKKWW